MYTTELYSAVKEKEQSDPVKWPSLVGPRMDPKPGAVL